MELLNAALLKIVLNGKTFYIVKLCKSFLTSFYLWIYVAVSSTFQRTVRPSCACVCACVRVCVGRERETLNSNV